MKRILVTTDFSEKSKAAIRFAIKLSLHDNYELTFYHVCNLLKPSIWTDQAFHAFEKGSLEKTKRKLTRFVTSIYKEIGALPNKMQYKIANANDVTKSILDDATLNHYDYICLSKNNEENFLVITGSIVSHLLKKSEIPLIIVPPNYKTGSIKSVLLATALLNLGEEVKISVEFAKSINAGLEILHLQGPEDFNLDPALMKQMIKGVTNYPVKIDFKNWDLATPLFRNMQIAIEERSPSILILFTDQDKNFVEKLLFPSFTKAFIEKASIPLLIFKK